jgi:HD-GYP domain-containing protein (c-di-GMP phosphodiesterase class II)
MITEKPYRKALTGNEALSEIKAAAGSIYDPAVVTVFEEVFLEAIK